MRVYTVKSGDTPASIAAKDTHAGCPKCSIDLIRANPHKKTVKHRNGYVTFESIRVGEELRLPDRWFDGTLDRLPKEYFVNLPHPDGVTPSKIGIGADYTVDIGPATMDPLVAKTIPAILVTTAQAAYTTLDKDPDYCASVARVGSTVNSAVHSFKTTWNASQSPPVPINTGNYERETADALMFVLGYAPPPCPTRTTTTYKAPPVPQPVLVSSSEKPGLSTGAVVGIALVGAAVVGGAIFFATKTS